MSRFPLSVRAVRAVRAVPLAVFAAAACAACSSSSTGASSGGIDASGIDAGGTDAGAEAAAGTGTRCTAAREQALLPINRVSTGAVSVVFASETSGTTLVYVDASAGGPQGASKSPRVYVNLEAAARVDLTDTQAFTSTAWDLALKRAVVYTNSGDTGLGRGGGAELDKPFASVTAADANAAAVAPERLFDDQCVEQKDAVGSPLTTFSAWYAYDLATNTPTPRDITYVVVGGTGKRYKVAITSYSALPDGGAGQATGAFLLKVAPL